MRRSQLSQELPTWVGCSSSVPQLINQRHWTSTATSTWTQQLIDSDHFLDTGHSQFWSLGSLFCIIFRIWHHMSCGQYSPKMVDGHPIHKDPKIMVIINPILNHWMTWPWLAIWHQNCIAHRRETWSSWRNASKPWMPRAILQRRRSG